MSVLPDRRGRPLRNLRLSVTDRCNLRCQYCMPEEEYTWLPKADTLTFEETLRLVDVFVGLGVDRVRITGGEPLLRRELPELVRMLSRRDGIRDLAMTTNGVLLAEHAAALREAGLQRVTVSLDTLDPETFRMLARRDDLRRVQEGLRAARAAGFRELKLDTVVIADINEHELPRLVEFARELDAELRFIEYMDVGGATHWRMDRVVSRARMLQRLAAHFGDVHAIPRHDSAPAERFTLPDGTPFGIISSVTQPFCATCDRARLTADGMWFTCLYATTGTDLRAPLRAGADDATLRRLMIERWTARDDRGAELRAGMPDRSALTGREALRRDPHLEMHTRGG
ncbi:MAG: GTP 3',8-cyclase MoaA [Planctomycetota bacterium]